VKRAGYIALTEKIVNSYQISVEELEDLSEAEEILLRRSFG
jgi:hypothetical protein